MAILAPHWDFGAPLESIAGGHDPPATTPLFVRDVRSQYEPARVGEHFLNWTNVNVCKFIRANGHDFASNMPILNY
jgi:hypothetical protein